MPILCRYSKFNYISIFFVVIPIKIYNASIYYDFYYLDIYIYMLSILLALSATVVITGLVLVCSEQVIHLTL